MRHLNAGRKLNRTSAHRKALMKNLVLSLIHYGRLKTTDAKAKELRRWADRMVTLGKRGDLAARRRAYAFIGSHTAVKKLFDEIAPRFMERPGGYTRVIKYGVRRGDAAPISIIEFTGSSETAAPRKKRRKAEPPRASARSREAGGDRLKYPAPGAQALV
jgi:large subunit ribosomal protein L17